MTWRLVAGGVRSGVGDDGGDGPVGVVIAATVFVLGSSLVVHGALGHHARLVVGAAAAEGAAVAATGAGGPGAAAELVDRALAGSAGSLLARWETSTEVRVDSGGRRRVVVIVDAAVAGPLGAWPIRVTATAPVEELPGSSTGSAVGLAAAGHGVRARRSAPGRRPATGSRHPTDPVGSAGVGLAAGAGLLLGLLALAVGTLRLSAVSIEVSAASRAAARAAARAPDRAVAGRAAEEVVADAVGHHCRAPQVALTGDWSPGGRVEVSVTCTVPLDDLMPIGFGARRTVHHRAVEPVDRLRAAGPGS